MNLNKKNTFTEEWEQRFPNVAKHFKNWIDEYKRDIDWNELFQNGIESYVKFHDVPLELQYGIICKWLNTFRRSYTINCVVDYDNVHNSFIWWCQYIEATVYNRTEN